MKDHGDTKRRFHRCHKAHYAKPEDNPSYTIGMYHDDGSTSGEFTIKWSSFGNTLVPKLIAWDDSWSSLMQFQDLLKKMAELDDQNINEESFYKMLLDLKIEDITKYDM